MIPLKQKCYVRMAKVRRVCWKVWQKKKMQVGKKPLRELEKANLAQASVGNNAAHWVWKLGGEWCFYCAHDGGLCEERGRPGLRNGASRRKAGSMPASGDAGRETCAEWKPPPEPSYTKRVGCHPRTGPAGCYSCASLPPSRQCGIVTLMHVENKESYSRGDFLPL